MLLCACAGVPILTLPHVQCISWPPGPLYLLVLVAKGCGWVMDLPENWEKTGRAEGSTSFWGPAGWGGLEGGAPATPETGPGRRRPGARLAELSSLEQGWLPRGPLRLLSPALPARVRHLPRSRQVRLAPFRPACVGDKGAPWPPYLPPHPPFCSIFQFGAQEWGARRLGVSSRRQPAPSSAIVFIINTCRRFAMDLLS